MPSTTDQQSTGSGEELRNGAEIFRQELLAEINRLNRFSMRGLLALSLFLLVCIPAWHGFRFLPKPEAVSAILGAPPNARLISIVLLLYTFSAIILSLSRLATNTGHRSSFCHVGYLSVFFLFYYFDKSLPDNYLAVLGAGITILGVESYRIWAYCSEALAQKKEELEFLDRNGRLPPDTSMTGTD